MKVRRYYDLTVCILLLYTAAGISGLYGWARVMVLLTKETARTSDFSAACYLVGNALGCLIVAGLIRLAINAAEDVEATRRRSDPFDG